MISIKTRGLDKLKKMIDDLPRAVRGLASKEAAYYLVGNERRGLQYYPPRVEHNPDNPYQWQSEKQRRYVMAKLREEGDLPYTRTQTLRYGWQVIEQGVQSRAVNNVPYAQFVQGDNQQRGHRADGWHTIPEIIKANTAGMMRTITQAVDRWIKSKEK